MSFSLQIDLKKGTVSKDTEKLNPDILYDLLVIGGTSLVVYPAAGLVQYFRGDDLVVCNLQATSQDSGADLVCACDISKTFDF